MLKCIRIKNYRGFTDCEINGLGRINVFAGANNSGKTTLLEALLWLSANKAECLFNPTYVRVDIPMRREPSSDSNPSKMPNYEYRWSTAWQTMFHDLATGTPIEIFGEHDTLGDMKLTLSTSAESAVKTRILSPVTMTNGYPDDIVFTYEHSDNESGVPLTITVNTKRDDGYRAEYSRRGVGVPLRTVLVDMHDISGGAERFTKLKTKKADASVLEAVQRVDPSIMSMDIGILKGHPAILVDVGFSDLIPLQILGAGPQKVATLAMSAATAAGGIMLIDEFDVGLHYSTLHDVWNALHEIAEANNVQVFATTHSYECIRAAAAALGDGEPQFYRLQDGEATYYQPHVLANAMIAGMEVR